MRLSVLAMLALLPLCVPLLAAGQTAPPKVEYLTSEQAKTLKLPFSEAVRVGDVLYLSGQIGIAPGTMKLVPGGIEAEAKQALANIRATLERYGSGMDRVFKCTVMLADISEWQKFNAVYVTFFDTHFPARSALGASGLALGARVEIECMATVSPGK